MDQDTTLVVRLDDDVAQLIRHQVSGYIDRHLSSVESAEQIKDELSAEFRKWRNELFELFQLVQTITDWLGTALRDANRSEGLQREPLDLKRGPAESYKDIRQLAYDLRTQLVQYAVPQRVEGR